MSILLSFAVLVAVALLVMSLRPAWDTISSGYVARQRQQALQLGIDPRRIERCLRWWGGAMVMNIVLLGSLGQMWLLAAAVAALLLWAPRWWMEWTITQRTLLLRDQMVGCCQALSNAARAGQSLVQGLQSVSQETPEPLAGELQRIVADYQHGRPLPEVLRECKRRLNQDSFTMFSSAIVVSLERGGRVTESLERISRSLQENQRIERTLAAETASGWRVVMILAAFPFLFLAGFYLLYPDGTLLLFNSLAGQSLLLLILGLVVASVVWSRQILKIDI